MNKIKWTAWTLTAALAAGLGACAGYVETDGGYVEAGTLYPDRVHYYVSSEPDFVFFNDGPEVVRRHLFTERDGRRYYFEHDHRGDRRVFYDHERALHNHAPAHHR